MIRALVIDDNTEDVRMIKDMLLESGLVEFCSESAETLSEGFHLVSNDKIDVALLDLGLPDSHGLDTLKRFIAEAPFIPVVVLTGLDDEETGIEAVRIGAQDYIVKGNISPSVLAHALRYAIEHKQYENKVDHLNRILFAVRSINQMITTEEDADKLIEESCTFLVESHSYLKSWIVFIDENRNVRRIFKAGFKGKFDPLEEVLIRNSLPNCCKKAIQKKGVVIINDPVSECPDCPIANHYSSTASLAVRLEHMEKLYGVIVVCLPKFFTSQKEEIYLFHEIANDIAFALHSIELAANRRHTEQALKVSEEKYRAIFEEARDGIVLIDINTGYIVECNKEFERQTGRHLKDLKDMRIWELKELRQKEIARKKFLEIREKGVGFFGDINFLKPNGEILPVEFVSKVIRIGGKLYVQGLTRDITERKRAEKVLRESEELYKTLVSAIPDAIVMSDLDGKITFVSSQILKLHGYEHPKELLGKLVFELIVPGQYEKVLMNLQRALSSGVVKNIEYEMVKKNSSNFIGEISTALVRDANGKPKGFISVIRDITGRKELEESFRQAHKMEAVGRLAGGISHDLNNMLTVVLGHCEIMLKMIPDQSPFRKFLITIEEAGKRTAKLTRQMLAFSSKQVLQPRLINLNEVLLELKNILNRVIGEDIELIMTSLHTKLGTIMADPGQIEQVIMNLAINAKDAMPIGGKLIIETSNIDFDELYIHEDIDIDIEPGHYVQLAISDTGCGISKELRKRIFEPFFTTKEKGKGTGLGLSTAYGIVKQSGGHIWVYSELGHGTTFKICFPRVDKESEVAEVSEIFKDVRKGSETILLVEDERFVRDLILNTLANNGYQMIEAGTGDEALEICKKHSGNIDLMLTDVVMPGINGRVLADKLKEKYPSLKVLYMSGYTDNAILHYGVLDQDMNFIQKPFTPMALKRKLREILDEDKGFE